MSKRWTFEDDLFLAEFYETLGDFIGTHDLGRPAGAADARVKKLKACGAWEVLERHLATKAAYRSCLGLSLELDEDDMLRVDRAMVSSAAAFPASQPERMAG